jgi:hypothetical protein
VWRPILEKRLQIRLLMRFRKKHLTSLKMNKINEAPSVHHS